MSFRAPSVLPGFGLTFGFTTFFLSAMVLLPLAALVLAAGSMHWSDFVHVVFSARALGSYRLSLGASFLAASINLGDHASGWPHWRRGADTGSLRWTEGSSPSVPPASTAPWAEHSSISPS